MKIDRVFSAEMELLANWLVSGVQFSFIDLFYFFFSLFQLNRFLVNTRNAIYSL